MSDCFDHALDAYDSWDMGDRENYEDSNGFCYNKHYIDIEVLRIVHSTEKAILVEITRKEFISILDRKPRGNLPETLQVWIPESVIRECEDIFLEVHRRTVSNNIKNVLLKMFPGIKF